MRRRGVLSAAYFVPLVALILAIAVPASAAVVQITSSGTRNSERPAVSADNSKVVFQSDADLVPGGNTDHSVEIFVIDSNGTGLQQLTSDPDSAAYAHSPAISGDGSVVVFSWNADPLTTNADGSNEIFLVQSDGGGLQQLTSETSSCDEPEISADGSTVVFQSGGDLSGHGTNTDDTLEVFLIDVETTHIVQLTSCSGSDECANPSISADGSTVVFQSQADLVGDNPDGLFQVFAVNADATGLTQLSSMSAANAGPYEFLGDPNISADGSKVVFDTDADLISGENTDGSTEIFLVNIDGTGLTQLTDCEDASYYSWAPHAIADGSQVIFSSSADLTGENSDHGEELFVMEADTSGVTQLTDTADPGLYFMAPDTCADGCTVVASTDGDVTGYNADGGSEVFLISVEAEQGVNWTPWTVLEYEVPLTPTSVPIAVDDGMGWVSAPSYDDVATDYWAWAEIEECSATHSASSDFIVQGYGAGTYQPTWQVNRAQMAVFVARAAGLSGVGDPDAPSFTDVTGDYWAFDEIESCVAGNIVQGYLDGLYRPTEIVDRGQMAVYIYRAAGLSTASYAGAFDDVAEDFWAALEIEACADANIVQGYPGGVYLPDNAVTRSQMAVFVWRGLVRYTGGDVVLGGPEATDDAWLVPTGGEGMAELFLPDAVAATGANTVDAAPGAVVYIVLDAAEVGDGTIDFDLTDSADTAIDSKSLTVDASAAKAAVDSSGGVPYLVASYQIESGLAAEDYTLAITLPNGNVQAVEFTVE